MIKENQSSSRSAFLKKASVALVSVFGLGFVGFNFKKPNPFSGNGINSLSKNEANDLIKGMNTPNVKRIKPEAPPKKHQD